MNSLLEFISSLIKTLWSWWVLLWIKTEIYVIYSTYALLRDNTKVYKKYLKKLKITKNKK